MNTEFLGTNMYIETLLLGLYENNCYIVREDKDANDCIIIDTGLDSEPLLDFLKDNELNPVVVICTHGHVDHISAIPALRRAFPNIKVAIHKNDAEMLTNEDLNLSRLAMNPVSSRPADIIIDGEKEIEFIGIKFDVIETPGHTAGGICLYNAENGVIFTGDTLFAGSIGRTDFPGYDQEECFQQLIGNIRTKLLSLPEETRAYTGHGPSTTLRNEKKNNPYLKAHA